MTNEQIEQAAKQYAQYFIEDDYSKAEERAFIAGAKWYINSVRHSNKEMPSIEIDEYGSGKDCVV